MAGGDMSAAREAAEVLALGALAWISRDERLAGRLLALTGVTPVDLRNGVGDAEFLGFVLDFLLADEEALLAYAAAAGLDPAQVMRARAALPGGAQPEWT